MHLGVRAALLILAAAAGGAQGANQVTFTLASPQAGHAVATGAPITWSVAVDVAGDNQGLASYALDLILHRGDVSGPVADDVTLAVPSFSPSFNVDGYAGSSGAPISASYLVGGPAMSFAIGGTPGPGIVSGFGALYVPPWTCVPESERNTHGVGLAARKTALLLDPSGAYVVNDGSFAAPAVAGTYTVELAATGASVLKPGINLDANYDGNFSVMVSPTAHPGDVLAGDSFSFTVLMPVVADHDADGDVDLADFTYFLICFNGPRRPPAAGSCEQADFDSDSDVDLADFTAFLICFNGPARPPACP